MEMKKKKAVSLFLSLMIGFAIAMAIMAVTIYFGYSAAYKLGAEHYSVKLLGLKIYELSKVSKVYTGASIGLNMGIICMACMVIVVGVVQLANFLFGIIKKK